MPFIEVFWKTNILQNLINLDLNTLCSRKNVEEMSTILMSSRTGAFIENTAQDVVFFHTNGLKVYRMSYEKLLDIFPIIFKVI